MTAAEVDPWSLPTYPERIVRALAELQQAVAILTETDGVSHACSGVAGENGGTTQKASPAVVGATNRALTPNPDSAGMEAGMSILAHQTDENPAVEVGTDPRVARMRATLDRVIRQRELLRAENDELTRRLIAATTKARHWFVDDGAGYCQACSTPSGNARHVARAA